MMTLTEIFEALKNDLARMPTAKAGTPWHLDRAMAFFRVSRQLGLYPSAIAATE